MISTARFIRAFQVLILVWAAIVAAVIIWAVFSTRLDAHWTNAQQTPHVDIVAAAKAAAIAAGHDPDAPGQTDECNRFEVTNRAAYALRSTGAGVLDKPGGNNCRGYAVDIIVYLDGTIVDVLGGGANGQNTPMWQVNPNKVDPARWRPAFKVGDSTPVPTPTPGIPGPQGPAGPAGPKGDKGDKGEPGSLADMAGLLARLAALEARLAGVACTASVNLGFARVPARCIVMVPQ